ncbi:7 transmembrane receptor [Dictyocaulus viviparus]|uniref:7 transmembrane receptor n=1 Tax=Dictyocaulus viviparus TaxID=29172 RepID=A0A0D8YAH8_DICVI|nr:7 transmembrane receptor [Dictyocaulus viviparus]
MANCSAPPPDLTVTSSILAIVSCYIIVFIISFVGNFIMFLILCRNQLIKVRRVHSLLLQMNIAHLIVTLFYMPKEIMHNYTVAWYGGDILCRLCKFFDVFGIALSMNILICISLDRFYSIFFPLYAMRARKSVQKMVMVAWITSFATSAPQFYLFKTATHPCYPTYTQCVSRNLVNEISTGVVFYFSILNIIQVYFFPLLVTVVCYSLILWKISEESATKKKGEALLRCSGINTLQRARSRTLRTVYYNLNSLTLRMTFVIVVAFICCWTPYAIMMFLHFLTKTDWIPKDVRKFIYAFAVFNSAISPYLYGYFSFDVKKELRLLFTCFRKATSDGHISCSTNFSRGIDYASDIFSYVICLYIEISDLLPNWLSRSQQSQQIRRRSASTTAFDPSNYVMPPMHNRVNSLHTPMKPVVVCQKQFKPLTPPLI